MDTLGISHLAYPLSESESIQEELTSAESPAKSKGEPSNNDISLTQFLNKFDFYLSKGVEN